MASSIRVDQSHCNFQLSKTLVVLGWEILFRDPGRVSRGFSGSQECVLGIFERNGWPIPDIACTKGAQLLLIEVDKSIRNNVASLDSYQKNSKDILGEFARVGYVCSSLVVGFCRVGIATEADHASVRQIGGLLVADFPEALAPRLVWSTG